MNVFHDKKEEINLRSCYKDKRATEFFFGEDLKEGVPGVPNIRVVLPAFIIR